MATVTGGVAEEAEEQAPELVVGVRAAELPAIQAGGTEGPLGGMVVAEVPEVTEQVAAMEVVVAEEGRTVEEEQEGCKHLP
jgi:hypothetical protein